MSPNLRLFSLAISVLVLVGCASYTQETREIRSMYRASAHARALELLEKSSLKDQSRNRLLYRLEKAMILDRLGQREKSRKLLLEADRIGDELYTVSATKTAASFIYNDSATDYAGEDYELVAIHTQLALSFLEDEDFAAARVEAAKINNKLAEINEGYDEDKNKYAEDAFARYLAGVIYEKRGEWDDAIIDYTKALDLYEGSFAPFADGVPDHLVKSLYRLLDMRGRTSRLDVLKKDYPKLTKQAAQDLKKHPKAGQIVVIHEAGHIAVKQTGEFFFQVGSQLVRFSYPTIRDSGSGVRPSGMEVRKIGSGGKLGAPSKVWADEVQNLDDIARQTLEDKRGRLIAKQTARLLAKGQLAEQARQNFGILGAVAANVYTVVTETADTRGWTLLPESYQISRVRLAPGQYEVRIKTDGRLGDIRKIKVAQGAMTIFRDVATR